MPERWRHFLQFAVLRLGLTPRAFWSMSLPELEALYEPFNTAAGASEISRQRFEAMQATYPDHGLPSRQDGTR